MLCFGTYRCSGVHYKPVHQSLRRFRWVRRAVDLERGPGDAVVGVEGNLSRSPENAARTPTIAHQGQFLPSTKRAGYAHYRNRCTYVLGVHADLHRTRIRLENIPAVVFFAREAVNRCSRDRKIAQHMVIRSVFHHQYNKVLDGPGGLTGGQNIAGANDERQEGYQELCGRHFRWSPDKRG